MYPTIEARIQAGQPLNNADDTIPAELRDAVNALERAKDVTIYAGMKIAMKYMQALENEEEFIENLANLLIDLYAVDSAQARAIQAVRRGDEKSGMHVKLAQLATWLAFSRLRSNLDQMVMSNLSENEVQEELTRLRAYIGDYLVNGVTLQRELAAVIVEKQGYPL
jgi:lipopolysaccharide biosynthesis regulator YciM